MRRKLPVAVWMELNDGNSGVWVSSGGVHASRPQEDYDVRRAPVSALELDFIISQIENPYNNSSLTFRTVMRYTVYIDFKDRFVTVGCRYKVPYEFALKARALVRRCQKLESRRKQQKKGKK